MAAAGDRFEMPDGSVYTVVAPASATGGDYVEMEFRFPDRCVAPLPHVHPSQVEEYEVIEGSFEVMVDGEWSTLGPGESASVPREVLHTFRNRSGARPGPQLAPSRPALRGVHRAHPRDAGGQGHHQQARPPRVHGALAVDAGVQRDARPRPPP